MWGPKISSVKCTVIASKYEFLFFSSTSSFNVQRMKNNRLLSTVVYVNEYGKEYGEGSVGTDFFEKLTRKKPSHFNYVMFCCSEKHKTDQN